MLLKYYRFCGLSTVFYSFLFKSTNLSRCYGRNLYYPIYNEIRGKENRLLFNPAKKPEGLDESEENKSKKTED